MDAAKETFIKTEFAGLIKNHQNATARWGKMNLHQMTEHVNAFFNVSSGRLQLPLVTPPELLLMSNKEFRENTKAPAEIIGEEPLPVRTANMVEAISKLEKSITEFFDYFEQNPAATTSHPVFGPLNFEEWILLHYKHVLHHSKQFGLV
jgi:Protein of unknown function (DUF1569)